MICFKDQNYQTEAAKHGFDGIGGFMAGISNKSENDLLWKFGDLDYHESWQIIIGDQFKKFNAYREDPTWSFMIDGEGESEVLWAYKARPVLYRNQGYCIEVYNYTEEISIKTDIELICHVIDPKIHMISMRNEAGDNMETHKEFTSR